MSHRVLGSQFSHRFEASFPSSTARVQEESWVRGMAALKGKRLAESSKFNAEMGWDGTYGPLPEGTLTPGR